VQWDVRSECPVNTVTTTPVFATNPTGLNAVRFRQLLRWLLVSPPSYINRGNKRKGERRPSAVLVVYGRTGGGSADSVKELENLLLGKARKWQELNQGTISHVP